MIASSSFALEGSCADLARVLRCNESELHAALPPLQASGVADVTVRNSVVTIISRRLQREHKERESNALRQSKFREKQKSNNDVTSSSSSSSSPRGSPEGEVAAQQALELSDLANKAQEVAKHGFYDEFGNEIPVKLRAIEFMVSLREWHAYKRQRGEGYKSIGAKGLITRCEKFFAQGGMPFLIDCIKGSMGCNWAGVFPVGDGQKKSPARSASIPPHRGGNL
jgi:hypothetical protein